MQASNASAASSTGQYFGSSRYSPMVCEFRMNPFSLSRLLLGAAHDLLQRPRHLRNREHFFGRNFAHPGHSQYPTEIDLISVKLSAPSRPPLIVIQPAWSFRASWWAELRSLVHILAARPYWVSFAKEARLSSHAMSSAFASTPSASLQSSFARSTARSLPKGL